MAVIKRKERRTFSLAPDVVEYLEGFRKKARSASLTSAIEAVVRQQREREEIERLNADISAYYDSYSDEDRAEDLAWAERVGSALFQNPLPPKRSKRKRR